MSCEPSYPKQLSIFNRTGESRKPQRIKNVHCNEIGNSYGRKTAVAVYSFIY